MSEIIILAAIAAAGVLFLVFKIASVRRVLAFQVPIDIVATTVLCIAMAGTFTGITVGLIAGTMISAVLWFMKLLIGADTLTMRGWIKPVPTARKRSLWAQITS